MARRAIVVRGRLVNGRTIVLDEPVEGVEADVEVTLREADAASAAEDAESLVAVLRRFEIEAALRARSEPVDVEEIYRAAPAEGDVTESPVVIARRSGSATMPKARPISDDADTDRWSR